VAKNANSTQQLQRAGKRSGRERSAETRVAGVLPLLKFRAALAEGRKLSYLTGDGSEVSTWRELIAHRAHQVGVSGRTLYRWLARLEKFGERGLENRSRCDKGLFRKFQDRALAVAFVFARHVEGLTARAIHRALAVEWPKIYRDGSVAPCYDTLRLFVHSLVKVQP
jgi:hypothetical protein